MSRRVAGTLLVSLLVLTACAPAAFAMEMTHAVSTCGTGGTAPMPRSDVFFGVDNNLIEHTLQTGIPMSAIHFTYQILYSFFTAMFFDTAMSAETPHV